MAVLRQVFLCASGEGVSAVVDIRRTVVLVVVAFIAFVIAMAVCGLIANI